MLHLVTEVSSHLHQWAQMSRAKLHMARWAGRSQKSSLWKHRKNVLLKFVCSGHSCTKDLNAHGWTLKAMLVLCRSEFQGKMTNLQVLKCFLV